VARQGLMGRMMRCATPSVIHIEPVEASGRTGVKGLINGQR